MSSDNAGTGVMRLRCPKELAGDGGTHLAVNVRLPLSFSVLSTVSKSLTTCPCGAGMVMRTEPDERVMR